MTRCESYPPCFGTIYFPTAPSSFNNPILTTAYPIKIIINNFAICSIRSILSSIFALFSFSLKSKSIATLHSLRHCPTSNFKRSGLPDATRFLLFHFFSIGLFLVCQIFPSFKQYQIPCSLSRNLIFQTFLLLHLSQKLSALLVHLTQFLHNR